MILIHPNFEVIYEAFSSNKSFIEYFTNRVSFFKNLESPRMLCKAFLKQIRNENDQFNSDYSK